MNESRVVRETVEYEDGTVEERIIRRKDDTEEYSAPEHDGSLWALGLLAIGGLALFLLWRNREVISSMMSPTNEAIITEGSVIYKAETPQPMVGVEEYVGPISNSGRAIR